MKFNYETSNLSMDSGQSYEGESNLTCNQDNFASEVNKQMMSEYQLESNLGIESELYSNLNSNFDDYGNDIEHGTEKENLNSNMSSNVDDVDGENHLTNMSGSYSSNDSIRQYQKKKINGFDSENVKF
jgi:hypothetical protein